MFFCDRGKSVRMEAATGSLVVGGVAAGVFGAAVCWDQAEAVSATMARKPKVHFIGSASSTD
jgi:hypothetical protein